MENKQQKSEGKITAKTNKSQSISSSQAEEILHYLKKNQELSVKLHSNLKFIKRYYHWRVIFNTAKVVVVVLVIVLGIVSWNSISDFFNTFSGNVQQNFTEALSDGLQDKFIPN
jgi:flagellar biosynthesis protein FlhB